MRHGEAAALRWSDIDLKRGIVSISRSRDKGEENAPKTSGSVREIPLLPWALELLKGLPRQLRSDGAEFVFITPERKPMTDTWWPKRGAARSPEGRGIEGNLVQGTESSPNPTAQVLHHPSHIHRMGSLGRSQPQGARGVLWNLSSNDRTELRQVHAQGLSRTAHQRTSGENPRDRRCRKNRTPDRTSQGIIEKNARIPWRKLVEAGGIENPDRVDVGKNRRIFKGFSARQLS